MRWLHRRKINRTSAPNEMRQSIISGIQTPLHQIEWNCRRWWSDGIRRYPPLALSTLPIWWELRTIEIASLEVKHDFWTCFVLEAGPLKSARWIQTNITSAVRSIVIAAAYSRIWWNISKVVLCIRSSSFIFKFCFKRPARREPSLPHRVWAN